MRSLNVGGDFWGLTRHKHDRDFQVLSIPVMKSWDVLMTTEKGYFWYFVFIMVKENERANLCFLTCHGDTFVQSEHIKSFLADGCVQTHSRLSCLADIHTLSHCHSRTAPVVSHSFLFLKCFTLLLKGSELKTVDWHECVKNISIQKT